MNDKNLSVRNNFQEEILELFSRFTDEWPDLAPLNTNGFVPHMDVIERHDHYLVKADIPGADEKNIIVTLEKNILTIEGEKKNDVETEKENYLKSEISYGRFIRTFQFEHNVDSENSEATYKDGVLKIILRKGKRPKKTD